jgi:hypothetical protein
MPEAAIRVTGLAELNRALRKVDTDLPKQIRLALNQAAEDVAAGARSTVPKRSGKAAASYKARSTRTAARVAMGSARAPYAPWLDFGGKTGKGKSVSRPFYKEGRYLFPALRKQRPQFEQKLLDAVMGVAKDAGFEVR